MRTYYNTVCESIKDYNDVLLRQTLSSSPPRRVKCTILSVVAEEEKLQRVKEPNIDEFLIESVFG